MRICIQNLTKTFGRVRANDDICLSFAAGAIHAVLGENGAGKSTLMKVLSGFLQRDSGEIVLDAKPAHLPHPAAALQAGIGMVHQDPLDVPAFTSLENFSLATPRVVMPNLAAARRILLTLADQLSFSVAPDTPVARLTVGQRQQLEIMRLLACGARVLILDEPTTGISATQKSALFAALRRLAEEGKTVLFVSHKLEEVAELCHTVAVLRAGRLVGEGQMIMPQPQERLLTLMFGQEATSGEERPTDSVPTVSPSSPTRSPPVWQLESVTMREGNLTVRDVQLAIRPGRVIGLAGLEGSGQQLLLRLLTGRLHPDAGCLLINGTEMTHASKRAFRQAGIQYVPADRLVDGIIGAFSLTEHLALLRPTSRFWVERQAAQESAAAAIAAYGIKATPNKPLAALSGGNQQRAMLALLAPTCRGLVLDQPTRGLDVVSARGIWQRLLARRQDGTALVFASADLDELIAYSDDILVFCGGHVSPLLPRAELSAARLAELIGGVGFEALHG